MDTIYHIPAMLKETIEGLAIKPNGVYVDVLSEEEGTVVQFLTNCTNWKMEN